MAGSGVLAVAGSPSSRPCAGGAPAARCRRRPRRSGLLEMGSGEQNGVRARVRESAAKSAVASSEKKGEIKKKKKGD